MYGELGKVVLRLLDPPTKAQSSPRSQTLAHRGLMEIGASGQVLASTWTLPKGSKYTSMEHILKVTSSTPYIGTVYTHRLSTSEPSGSGPSAGNSHLRTRTAVGPPGAGAGPDFEAF